MSTPASTVDELPSEPEAPPGDHAKGPSVAAKGLELVRRYPATSFVVFLALAAGVGTGGLWRDISSTSIYGDVAYGLPALQDGRWWTFFTGAFFVPQLVLYVPILLMLIAVAGAYERRVGHWQTLVIVVGGQVAGAVLTALLLWPFEDSGWTWAVELGRELDTGISAGLFAALAALTAVMQPVWRRRVRVGVSAYLVAMVLQSGLLWDVEHLLAWCIGLLVGPLLAGRRPTWTKVRLGRRSQRALVALIIAVTSVATLIEAVFPGNGGPFHAGNEQYHGTGVTLALVINSIIWLLMADALRRGRRLAWAITTGLMALSFVGLLGVDPSAERNAGLLISGLLLILLLATFGSFNARTRRRSFRRAARRLLMVAGALFVYTAVGFVVLREDFVPEASPADMIGEFFSRLVFTSSDNIEPVTTAAEWFVGSIGAVWLAFILVTIIGLLYSSRRVRPEPDQDDLLKALLRQHESSSIEWMLTWKGNDIWFSSDGGTAIGYRVVGSVALALSDPVGPMEGRLQAMKEFDKFCFNRGWSPCLFAAGEATAALAPQVRWKAIQVAEDSVVPLEQLEFKGKAWQDIRTAINKAGKADIRLVPTQWAEAKPVVTDQLQAISHGWVSDKSLPEMGFTLGTLAEADDPDVRLNLALDGDATVHGFTSWMPVAADGDVVGWTIDLMRRRDGGFRQVMEFLIGESAMLFKEQGYRFISLSAAPLAKAPQHLSQDSDLEVLQRLLDFLGDALEPYYGFRSLLSFKAKFQPEFRPMYLVFPDETALVEIGISIVRAYLPDAGPLDYVRMGRSMVGGGSHG